MGAVQSAPLQDLNINTVSCTTNEGTFVAANSAVECRNALLAARKSGQFRVRNNRNGVLLDETSGWAMEYSCNDASGLSLGANISDAGKCKEIAISKGVGATYLVKFDGGIIETQKFDAPAPKIDTDSLRRTKFIERNAQLNDEIKRFYDIISTEYAKIDPKSLDSMKSWNAKVSQVYGSELPRNITNLQVAIECDLASIKESFSQPDLGTYQGYDIFLILMVLILIVVVAVFFGIPAKAAKIISRAVN